MVHTLLQVKDVPEIPSLYTDLPVIFSYGDSCKCSLQPWNKESPINIDNSAKNGNTPDEGAKGEHREWPYKEVRVELPSQMLQVKNL